MAKNHADLTFFEFFDWIVEANESFEEKEANESFEEKKANESF